MKLQHLLKAYLITVRYKKIPNKHNAVKGYVKI